MPGALPKWPALIALFLGLGLLPGTIRSAPPEEIPPQQELLALVVQLGDEKFSSRESATEKLIAVGLPAVSALEEGKKNPDREIRFRSERIIYMVLRSDFQRRLESFAEQYDAEKEYDLPGWDRYRELVGDDAEARSLFVEMQRAENEVLTKASESPQAASDALAFRTVQLQDSMRLFQSQLTLGNVAAMVFLAADKDVTLGQQANSVIYSFCYQQAFQTAIQSGSNKPLVRKLLGAWVARGEDWTAYQGLTLAMRHDLKEGLIPAEKILNQPANQAHVTQYALLTIAKLGDESHIPLLEKSLTDKTITSTRKLNADTYQTQMRDIALAALVQLTKQDHKEFGFAHLQPNAQVVFNTGTIGFKDEEERQAAFKKWEDYREMNKSAEKENAAEKQSE